jgi:hypothetical protein
MAGRAKEGAEHPPRPQLALHRAMPGLRVGGRERQIRPADGAPLADEIMPRGGRCEEAPDLVPRVRLPAPVAPIASLACPRSRSSLRPGHARRRSGLAMHVAPDWPRSFSLAHRSGLATLRAPGRTRDSPPQPRP